MKCSQCLDHESTEKTMIKNEQNCFPKVVYEGLRDAESLDFIDKLEIATEE